MKFLVTGGLGFIGSNLSQSILKKKNDLCILDNKSRVGCEKNLKWLRKIGKFKFYNSDIRNQNSIDTIIKKFKPSIIFHLAGQVAMTSSIIDPKRDFEINALGSLNILEAVRKFSPKSIIIFSSTNKVYGELKNLNYVEKKTRYTLKKYPHSIDENTGLDFQSPYGCSKGSADQYMLDYARNYNLRTIVFRHSTVFGMRQFSSYDQGWVTWFIGEAILLQKKFKKSHLTISGNGKQVRDVLFISDLINCYFMAIKNYKKCIGKSYNIGGGIKNSISIIELFNILEKELNIKIKFLKKSWRNNDQKYFVANIKKAKKDFSWAPKVNKLDGIRKMIEWKSSSYD